jgi:hypothetical protein
MNSQLWVYLIYTGRRGQGQSGRGYQKMREVSGSGMSG